MENTDIMSVMAQTNAIYENLFLIAIEKHKDLGKLAIECDEHMRRLLACDEVYCPRGFDGLLFLNLLSLSMDVKIHDVVEYGEEERKRVIMNVLDAMRKERIKPKDLHISDERDQISFDLVYTLADEKANDVQYLFRFCATKLGLDEEAYSIEAFLPKDGNRSSSIDYIHKSAVIWNEKDGAVADYIKAVLGYVVEDFLNERKENKPNKRIPAVKKLTSIKVKGKIIGKISVLPYSGHWGGEIPRGMRLCYVITNKGPIKMFFDESGEKGYVEKETYDRYKNAMFGAVDLYSEEEYLNKIQKGKQAAYMKRENSVEAPNILEEICKECGCFEYIFQNGLCWECFKEEIRKARDC